MIKTNTIKYTLLFIIVFLVWNCSFELPCEYTDGVQVNAAFYSYDGTARSDTALSNLSVIQGNDPALQDTLYYTGSTTEIQFGLSIIDDTSQVILVFNDSISDTIIFYHDANLTLESHKCGFVEFFDISSLTTTSNLLDSIRLSKTTVDYGSTENIKIFF